MWIVNHESKGEADHWTHISHHCWSLKFCADKARELSIENSTDPEIKGWKKKLGTTCPSRIQTPFPSRRGLDQKANPRKGNKQLAGCVTQLPLWPQSPCANKYFLSTWRQLSTKNLIVDLRKKQIFVFIYLLKNNCFTEFCCFLTSTRISHRYIHVPSLPSPSPSHPSRLLQSPCLRYFYSKQSKGISWVVQ